MPENNSPKSIKSQNLEGVFFYYKKLGETLAVCLSRFLSEKGFDEKNPVTYAGRLDPAAEGVVLFLAGDARFKKDDFLKLDKTYILTVLFGISTDTADLLGVPKELGSSEIGNVENVVQEFVGKLKIPYPDFSSKLVLGKPLFAYAREGKKVEKQFKDVEVYSVEILDKFFINKKDLLNRILFLTKTVQGDFRQKEVFNSWKNFLNKEGSFNLLKIRVHCSSGTYMRSLAEMIAERIGTVGCAYEIIREKIGDFTHID